MKTKEEVQAEMKQVDDYIAKLPQTKKFQVKADYSGTDVSSEPVVTYSDLQYLYDRISSLRDDYYRIWDAIYKHQNEGHLPPIEGAANMQKALKAVGLDGDYEVKKKTIYASDGSINKIVWEASVKS